MSKYLYVNGCSFTWGGGFEDELTDLNYTVAKREKLFGTGHEMIDFRCEQDIPSHVEF